MTTDIDLEFDVDELSAVLGEPVGSSDVDRQYFRFKYEGHSGRTIILSVSKYTRRVGVVVETEHGDFGTSIEKADFVRVLEAERRTIEIVSSEYKTRCFVALDGDSAVSVSVGDTDYDW